MKQKRTGEICYISQRWGKAFPGKTKSWIGIIETRILLSLSPPGTLFHGGQKRSCDSRAAFTSRRQDINSRSVRQMLRITLAQPRRWGGWCERRRGERRGGGGRRGQGPCKSEHRGPTRCNQIKCQKCLGHYIAQSVSKLV